jgi:hypothetical protein
MQTRVSTGVSYNEYPGILSEAKFAVRSFTESPLSNNYPKTKRQLEQIVVVYDIARHLWNAQSQWRFSESFSLEYQPDLKPIVDAFPAVQALRNSSGFYDYAPALAAIWQDAAVRIEPIDSIFASESKFSQTGTVLK